VSDSDGEPTASERPEPRVVRIDTRPKTVDPRGLLTPELPDGPERDSKGSGLVAIALALGLVVGGGLLYKKLAAPEDPSELPASTASASASQGVTPPPPPRCVELSQAGGFVVGELPAEKKREPAPAGSSDLPPLDDGPPDEADFAPFAVVFGRATATAQGYAVGALRDGEGGTLLTVVTLGADGTGGKAVKLARSRGDLEPPVVVPDGDAVLAAMLEPNASGMSVKLARVRGDKVEWGAEIDRGRGDSLALDLATSGERGLVVWDEPKEERARVMLASFSRGSIGTVTAARAVSPEGTDADAPRLVSRKGGYYLAYLAHGSEITRPREAEDDLGSGGAKDAAKKGDASARDPKRGASKGDEIDESRGERVTASWVEILALDENGAPTGSPLRATPEAGRVAGFDLLAVDDGALLAWRNEESPSGAGGGQVAVAKISAGGVAGALTLEEGAGDGVPVLMNGWLSIPTLRGADMLARLGPDGKTSEVVEAEPSIGRGEPLAAIDDHVLVGEPEGRAMRLKVLRCGPKASAPKPAASTDDEP
jgi:hypothetical protein